LSPIASDPLKSSQSGDISLFGRDIQSFSATQGNVNCEEKARKHPRKESLSTDEKMDVDEGPVTEIKSDGGVFKELLRDGSGPSGAQPAAAAVTAPSISDGALCVTLEDIFNVRITVGTGDSEDAKNRFPPELTVVKEILDSVEEGQTLDFNNIVSAICFEIVTRHTDGSLRDLKRIASAKDASTSGSSSQSNDEIDAKDLALCLTTWFVDSLERSFVEERKYPKVIIVDCIALVP
jgi:hypothetical protein